MDQWNNTVTSCTYTKSLEKCISVYMSCLKHATLSADAALEFYFSPEEHRPSMCYTIEHSLPILPSTRTFVLLFSKSAENILKQYTTSLLWRKVNYVYCPLNLVSHARHVNKLWCPWRYFFINQCS